MRWEKERCAVLEAAQALLRQGLVAGTSGNVSARVHDGTQPERLLLAITPSGRYYDTLSPADIVVVDDGGNIVEGTLAPSVEFRLHAGIYQTRPDVGGVIHTHSVYASAAGLLGRGIPPLLEDQVVYLGGDIPLAEYAPPGSEELRDKAVAALGQRNAVLLPHHGAIGVGRDLKRALWACQLVEKTACIYLLLLSTGQEISPLPEGALEHLQAYHRLMSR